VAAVVHTLAHTELEALVVAEMAAKTPHREAQRQQTEPQTWAVVVVVERKQMVNKAVQA
jgi:hypothetical protein